MIVVTSERKAADIQVWKSPGVAWMKGNRSRPPMEFEPEEEGWQACELPGALRSHLPSPLSSAYPSLDGRRRG